MDWCCIIAEAQKEDLTFDVFSHIWNCITFTVNRTETS